MSQAVEKDNEFRKNFLQINILTYHFSTCILPYTSTDFENRNIGKYINQASFCHHQVSSKTFFTKTLMVFLFYVIATCWRNNLTNIFITHSLRLVWGLYNKYWQICNSKKVIVHKIYGTWLRFGFQLPNNLVLELTRKHF